MSVSSKKRSEARPTGGVDKEIGARIRCRRLELRMSQAQLGESIGLAFQQIQKYELGTNRVAASTLTRIADVLNVSIGALLPSTEEKENSVSEECDELKELRVLVPKLGNDGRATLLVVARSLLAVEAKPKRRYGVSAGEERSEPSSQKLKPT